MSIELNQLNLSNVGRAAPPVPSKHDVIPIHTSDRANFKDCRRKWSWSSPARRNLMPKTMVHGVREPLWFGTGIHYALERYYNPQLHEDPVTTWLTWFNLEWNGGIVTPDQVAQYVDRNPQSLYLQEEGAYTAKWNGEEPSAYHVEGLSNIMPFVDEEKFMGLKDLGAGMLRYYKEYAEANDNFTVISTEHDFSVPILTPRGEALYMIDKRPMPDTWEPDLDNPNDFGPLMRLVKHPDKPFATELAIEKQVHARGRMDVIVQDNESGQFGVRDYKTTSRLDEDYFRHQELDEQCTTYLWAGEVEAKINDLEYKQLDYIDYVGLFKAYPKPPTKLKNGMPSIARGTESTTAALFEKYILDNNLKPIYDADPKWQSYYTWLLETDDKRFINIKPIRRNAHQKRNMGIRIYYEALDMLNDPVGYPNPRKEYPCLNCIFRGPCIAAEDGSDYESILADGYTPNWDR